MRCVQRFVQDCSHVSEHARAHDAAGAAAAASKAAYIGGNVLPSGRAEARELLRGKSTLFSKDEETLCRELNERLDAGEASRRGFLAQTTMARGSMLHTAFPAAGWPLQLNGAYPVDPDPVAQQEE